MEYAELATFFERLEGETKRLQLTAILVELFDGLDKDEFAPVAYLLQGKVAPDWEGVELGLAEKLVLRTLAGATGHKDPQAVYHDLGDLGLAAQRLLETRAGARQSGLFSFGGDEAPASLTVRDVFDRLRAIADESGAGSQEGKQKLLAKLLHDATPLGARYLIRTVAGRARLGVADMTFLDALTAWHVGRGVRSVQEMTEEERAEHEDVRRRLERGYDVTSDLARVADVLVGEGLASIDKLDVTIGVPLRPMAAERLKTLPEILEKHGGRSALEYKYDGLRIQAHIPAKGRVRLFSRRMEELTDQFPDATALLREAFRGKDAVVEGECVAIDLDTLKMRPFQELSRRRGRKYGLGTAGAATLLDEEGSAVDMTKEVPVGVFLFDCLAVGGHSVMDEPYEVRRKRLEGLFAFSDRVQESAMEVAGDEAAMEAFFARAVQDGAEGIMCKSLTGPYKAGNRGFDWIKYKTDYTEDLVDTMDLVVIGAYYGRGRRAGWYGALLMAACDDETGTYPSVCKLGTGFDDETLQSLKDRFKENEAQECPPDVQTGMEPDVWFHPAVVMEVQAAELTLSPTHRAAWGRLRPESGLAARFPRFSGRWRDDKGPEQATTVSELVRMYKEQGKR